MCTSTAYANGPHNADHCTILLLLFFYSQQQLSAGTSSMSVNRMDEWLCMQFSMGTKVFYKYLLCYLHSAHVK